MSARAATEQVELFVDPSCPFAWITAQWLLNVEKSRQISLTVRLLSLAVVNEHRDLDAWYRKFNDAAWAPARVMAAVETEHGATAARNFYQAFGQRFHVDLDTSDDADRVKVAVEALAEASLPADLVDATTATGLDDHLRAVAARMRERVGVDVGVPVITIDGVAASGPVLSRIPHGDEALALFDAIAHLSRHDGFIRYERQRSGRLHTNDRRESQPVA